MSDKFTSPPAFIPSYGEYVDASRVPGSKATLASGQCVSARPAPFDTGKVHGPNPRCTCRPGSLGWCAGCVGVDFAVHGMRGRSPLSRMARAADRLRLPAAVERHMWEA
jgi:hypothetical protein